MAIFDFGTFPILGTARLDLLEFDAKFADDIFAVRGDPVVQLYNSAPHQTRDETLRFIAEQQYKYTRRQEITWGLRVRELGRVVGCVTLFLSSTRADWIRLGEGPMGQWARAGSYPRHPRLRFRGNGPQPS